LIFETASLKKIIALGEHLKTFSDVKESIYLELDNGIYFLQIQPLTTTESHKIKVKK